MKIMNIESLIQLDGHLARERERETGAEQDHQFPSCIERFMCSYPKMASNKTQPNRANRSTHVTQGNDGCGKALCGRREDNREKSSLTFHAIPFGTIRRKVDR